MVSDVLEEYRENQPEFAEMEAPIDKEGEEFFVNQNWMCRIISLTPFQKIHLHRYEERPSSYPIDRLYDILPTTGSQVIDAHAGRLLVHRHAFIIRSNKCFSSFDFYLYKRF